MSRCRPRSDACLEIEADGVTLLAYLYKRHIVRRYGDPVCLYVIYERFVFVLATTCTRLGDTT